MMPQRIFQAHLTGRCLPISVVRNKWLLTHFSKIVFVCIYKATKTLRQAKTCKCQIHKKRLYVKYA
jgi:hypothetical protein